MRTLAIDTSSRNTTVALLDGEHLIGQLSAVDYRPTAWDERSAISRSGVSPGSFANAKPGVSALLAPLLDQLLRQHDVSPDQIELFALTVGPGLFTGLRVGVVTAKTWSLVHSIPVIGVNTLEVIAARAAMANPDYQGPIRVCINAQRQQVFCGAYQSIGPWRVRELQPNTILGHAEFLASLQPGDLVSGTGMQPMLPQLEQLISRGNEIKLANEQLRDCDAQSVGSVAANHFQAGRQDDILRLKPLYFRPSAAEEKAGTRNVMRH